MEKEKQAANGLEFLSENSCFTYGDNMVIVFLIEDKLKSEHLLYFNSESLR